MFCRFGVNGEDIYFEFLVSVTQVNTLLMRCRLMMDSMVKIS